MNTGELVGDRFVIENLAGSGGMGAVFRARDTETGDPVALKILRSSSSGGENLDRFAREIQMLATMRHPGIVRYIADGVTDAGEPWLAMEWLEGLTVGDLIAGAGVTASQAVDLARRVAEAIGAVHERDIIHRDLKPSNLWLPDGDLARVKVLDFGLARLVGAGTTVTGIMVGTPGYMSPEQIRGDRDVGPRADVFALGCVLYECLVGQPVYPGDHPLSIMAKILVEDAPRVGDFRNDLPPELEDLVARALSRDPEQRPRSGAQLAAELAALDLVAVPGRRRTGLRTGVLTRTERRMLCVVLIGRDKSVKLDDRLDEAQGETLTGELPADALAAVRRIAQNHRATLERLAGGEYVVTVVGAGSAADHIVQAARCAIALHGMMPASPIALATGRGVMAGRWPVGEAIERAVAMVDIPSPHIRVDEVTGGLLDARFMVGGDASSLLLIAERDPIVVSRTVLGRPTPCVGRDRELALLVGLYDECVSEPKATAVLITGVAGVGKSRVRFEMMQRCGEKKPAPEIWFGRGDQVRAGSPFAIIGAALRRACGILDSEPAEVRRHKVRARVQRQATVFTDAADVTRTVHFLGELIGTPFADDDAPELRAARGDAQLMTDQIQRAFLHFLRLETAAQPVVIVLEDFHWGDLPTATLLQFALRALREAPLMIVGTARPEVHELLPKTWRLGVHEVRLDELSRKGSERLVRAVLGDETSDTLVGRIVEQAGGNSFYLEELIRAVAEGKRDVMPETVLAVVQGRLDRLEADARHVLRAASVFGQQFPRGGVGALVGAAREAQARQWLDELVAREMIRRVQYPRYPGEDEYVFNHAIVREAAYAMLTDADRKLGHKLAGQWLAKAGGADPITLAEHFDRAGERDRAAECYRRAAAEALLACDYKEASARAARGLACGARGELHGALLVQQAEAHRWSGEYAPALALAREAMALLPVGGGPWVVAAGEVAEAAGKLEDEAALGEVAVALRDAPDHAGASHAELAAAITHCVFQLFPHGFQDLALVLLARVERMTQLTPEPNLLARLFQARAWRAMFAGDVGKYLESEHAAADAFAAAGDRRYVFVQNGHVGYACIEIGAYVEAEMWLRQALAGAEQLGMQTVIATAKHNLGRALMHLGRLDEAFAAEQEALEMLTAHGDRRLEGAARTYLGEILDARGDHAGAEEHLRLALGFAIDSFRPQILALLAKVQLARGEVEAALGSARDAHDTLEAVGAIEEGDALVRLMLAETLLASGRRDEARAAIGSARARLLIRASKISDAAWRKSFLERVPSNARTMALAAELAGAPDGDASVDSPGAATGQVPDAASDAATDAATDTAIGQAPGDSTEVNRPRKWVGPKP